MRVTALALHVPVCSRPLPLDWRCDVSTCLRSAVESLALERCWPGARTQEDHALAKERSKNQPS